MDGDTFNAVVSADSLPMSCLKHYYQEKVEVADVLEVIAAEKGSKHCGAK